MTATASKSAADRKKGDTEVAATPAIAALRASYAVDSDPRLQRTGPSAGLRPVRLDYGFAVEKRSDEENSLEPLVSFGRRLTGRERECVGRVAQIACWFSVRVTQLGQEEL